MAFDDRFYYFGFALALLAPLAFPGAVFCVACPAGFVPTVLVLFLVFMVFDLFVAPIFPSVVAGGAVEPFF